ncbi:HPr family phosphocarrier protein [Clostridium sp. AM58-1XD]|uniref:HPr family phosphocarrier protein n=1 Tax=Clostridium sp. AM58-1XD TaxID=2292307 RepID=UPI000E4B1F54|nr:HPr family phosphocarrier protein [Clostridium sp. AM58-1XD]RGY98716.1 HPr family phosphocarrier protein [Clostridium sp. AM58-1XD]
MFQFQYTIKDELGIHARPAGILVKEVKKYASKVTIDKEGKTVDASKLMAVMSLGVKCGNEVTVTVEGEDEGTAGPEIEKFFKENL